MEKNTGNNAFMRAKERKFVKYKIFENNFERKALISRNRRIKIYATGALQ